MDPIPRPGDADDRLPRRNLPDPVSLHASLRGLLAAAVTPSALIAIGVAATVSGGRHWLPSLLTLAGTVLAVIVVFDVPRRSVFDANGVTRVCLARRHRLRWNQIVAIERSRPSTAATVRNLTEAGDERWVSGGLVARGRGPRRWLLTDQVESRHEYDRLADLTDHPDVATVLRAVRPHDTAAPTDLYRRRRRRG